MKRLVVAVVILALVLGPALACEGMVLCPYDGKYAYLIGGASCADGTYACKYAHGSGADRHVFLGKCE